MSSRIIYSLQYELEPLPGSRAGETRCLIVPLCRDGMFASSNGRRRPSKRHTIGLGVGDYILSSGQWRKIKGVKAYRDAVASDEHAAASRVRRR